MIVFLIPFGVSFVPDTVALGEPKKAESDCSC